MGSYAQLTIGSCTVVDWKSHVGLEPLLMFSSEDLVVGSNETEAGETFQTFKFATNVAAARRRIDERGVTVALCQELYGEFRSDLLWRFDPESGEDTFEPNDVSFEAYRSVLSRQLATRTYRPLPNEGEAQGDPIEGKINREDFFDETLYTYFADAALCLDLRLMLEAAHPDDTVTLDLTDLVLSGYLDAERISELYDDFFRLMLRRITLDYRIYGFVIDEDPRLRIRLRERIEGLGEDELIRYILLPLLERMGFERLRRVDFHGPGEFGSDILPFRFRTPLGTLEYYAVQAKAMPIHGSSSHRGNAAEIVSQATQALAVSFVDDLDNERKRLDKFIVATNKNISASARHFIESTIEGRRSLLFMDVDRLIDLLVEHRLAQYVLFSDLSEDGGAEPVNESETVTFRV